MISWRGPIYTVEEVSDLLGIPRPTLYRYLREYSIPHLRRSGKISIPEESFDRIREARDLHKEGLGTESVRRVLREGGAASSGELGERLDALSETLKDLQEKSATEDPASSPALRTMLARQSLLISAVFNLTEMVEDLLLASGKPRKTVFGDVSGEVRAVTPLPEYRAKRQLEVAGPTLTVAEPAREAPAEASEPAVVPQHRGSRFGYLSQRRRRRTLGILAVLAVLLVVVVLAWYLPSPFGAASPETSAGQQANESAAEAEDRAGAGGGESRDVAGDMRGDYEAGAAPADEEAPAGAPDGDGDSGGVTSGSEEVRPGEVPDVSGQSVEEAARTLSEAGFPVAAIRTEAGPEEAGTATGTDPAAGTAAEPGSPVTLVMSGGPGG